MTFAGLDGIDWSSMTHAYGPATEVPDAIRGLLARRKAPGPGPRTTSGPPSTIRATCTNAAAAPLLRAELADPVRVTYRVNNWDIDLDEGYVRDCERALVAVTGPGQPIT